MLRGFFDSGCGEIGKRNGLKTHTAVGSNPTSWTKGYRSGQSGRTVNPNREVSSTSYPTKEVEAERFCHRLLSVWCPTGHVVRVHRLPQYGKCRSWEQTVLKTVGEVTLRVRFLHLPPKCPAGGTVIRACLRNKILQVRILCGVHYIFDL